MHLQWSVGNSINYLALACDLDLIVPVRRVSNKQTITSCVFSFSITKTRRKPQNSFDTENNLDRQARYRFSGLWTMFSGTSNESDKRFHLFSIQLLSIIIYYVLWLLSAAVHCRLHTLNIGAVSLLIIKKSPWKILRDLSVCDIT